MLNNLKLYQVYFIHIVVLVSVYTFLFLTGIINFTPNEDLLIQWDAGWYKSIIENGYELEKMFKVILVFSLSFLPFGKD